METTIAMFDIRYEIKNAGPSPADNRRTELYFAGCNKASSGHACKNCFNYMIWSRDKALVKTPKEFIECIENHSVPKYLTLVGGEPTDQLEGLIEFARLAKEYGYHIILISWHCREWLEESLMDALKYFDIIIPGTYDENCRIYDESKDDGVHNVIGSANQFVWLPKENKIFPAGELSSLSLDKNNVLEVTTKDGRKEYIQQ